MTRPSPVSQLLGSGKAQTPTGASLRSIVVRNWLLVVMMAPLFLGPFFIPTEVSAQSKSTDFTNRNAQAVDSDVLLDWDAPVEGTALIAGNGMLRGQPGNDGNGLAASVAAAPTGTSYTDAAATGSRVRRISAVEAPGGSQQSPVSNHSFAGAPVMTYRGGTAVIPAAGMGGWVSLSAAPQRETELLCRRQSRGA